MVTEFMEPGLNEMKDLVRSEADTFYGKSKEVLDNQIWIEDEQKDQK